MAEMSDGESDRWGDQQRRWAAASLSARLRLAAAPSACEVNSTCYYKTGVAAKIWVDDRSPDPRYEGCFLNDGGSCGVSTTCAACGRGV